MGNLEVFDEVAPRLADFQRLIRNMPGADPRGMEGWLSSFPSGPVTAGAGVAEGGV